MDKRTRNIILYCVAGVLTLLALILGSRWLLSARYAGGRPTEQDPPPVMDLAFPEDHVAQYDHGCAAYQRGEFEDAERYFEMAAASPALAEGQDCDIRVNWALSICYQINFDDLNTDMKKKKAISYLHRASDILCENGCAVWGRQGQWHDDDAQQLEDDIEKMLSKLEEQQNSSDSNDQNQDQNKDQNQNQQQSSESDQEKQQREQKQQQIEDNRSQTMKESQRERRNSEEFSNPFSWGGGENW